MTTEESSIDEEPTETATEPSEQPAEEKGDGEEKKKRLNLAVELQEVGPCRKRIKVSIPQEDITDHFNEQFTELVENAEVPGFRPGHAPRRLIEKKYRKEVAEQVKRKLLMESLEQLDEEQKLHVIAEPQIDFATIEVPESGPMIYEFEVEVSPDFELPNYKGVRVKRPVKEFGEADVNKQLERFLESYAQLVPKTGAAEAGDFLVTDIVFSDGEQEISRTTELSLRIQPVLRFRDGTIEGFANAMVGVRADDVRRLDVVISDEAPNASLRGRKIQAEFVVKDLKRLRLPELNAEFLQQIGYDSEVQLRDALYSVLRRRLEYEQRRVARQQLMAQLLQSVRIDLPQDLVKRQVQSTLRRRVLELQNAGLSDDEIRRRQVELHQQSITVTQQSLREHFVLAKIAEAEELKVTPQDVDNQIELMAIQSEESPRRVRARLEKQGLLESLEIQILEQLAVDRALEYAQYEDVPLEERPEEAAEAVDQAATASDETEESEPAETESPASIRS